MKRYNPIVCLYTVIVRYENNRRGTKSKRPYYFHKTEKDAARWIDQTIKAKSQRYKLIEKTAEGWDRVVYNPTLQITWKYKIVQIFDYNIRII